MSVQPDPQASMVEDLLATGAIVSENLAHAFRSVARDHFLPEQSRAAAFVDQAVTVKCDGLGRPISSGSQPTMMAEMLEQLRPEAGDRILEIGTGTGYNAALLAELVGRSGSVVSVELEADLAAVARQRLTEAGYDQVEVVAGDGQDGYPQAAPYDRIIVTVGVATVSQAWTEQLVGGGRLIVPLVDDEGVGFATELDKTEAGWVRRSELPCRFVTLRRPTPAPASHLNGPELS